MANDETSQRLYKYGELNPVLASESQEKYDDPTGGILSSIKQLVRKHHTPDARKGTGPYRGVVLRRNQDISDAETTPTSTWLANVFKTRSTDVVQTDVIPTALQSYQVYIPEIMTNLPRITKYVPHEVEDPEHGKINLYPTFVAKDASVSPASEGDIVWVDYGNRESLADPIYLGPIFPKPISDEGTGSKDTTGPKAAMEHPCGAPMGNPPKGKDLLSWNKHTAPTGELLSKNIRRIKPPPNIADKLYKDIEEYRKVFKVDKKIIWHPHSCRPKSGPNKGKYLCLFKLQELNDNGPYPGNIKGMANSNFISSSVHKPGGSHYEGYAIDIPAWTLDKSGKSDSIAEFWEAKGYAVIWRARGHYNHVHVGWGKAEQRRGGAGQRRIADPSSGEIPHGAGGKGCPAVEKEYVQPPPPPTPRSLWKGVVAGINKRQSDRPIREQPIVPSTAVTTSKPKIRKVGVKFDLARYDHAAGDGYAETWVRKDVARDITSVRDVLNNLGGVLATSGGARLLEDYTPGNKNRSLTSFHYTTMAFDLYTEAASLDPKSDPNLCEYVITKSRETTSSGRYLFDIWAKSNKTHAEYKGYKVERLRLDALTCPRRHNAPAKVVTVTGYYINLTKILSDHGFSRISGRSKWYRNCSSGSASEWWHMQSHNGLVPGVTKWEDALKKVYGDKRVEKSPPYKHRNLVFRGKGFSR